jgi:hypothetical protein
LIQNSNSCHRSLSRSASQHGEYFLAAVFISLLTGCLSRSLTSIQLNPAAGTATMTVGQTTQFQALALYTESGHADHTQDVSDKVVWTSSNPALASISSTGLATGLSVGSSGITATLQGSLGTVVGTSNVTVAAASTGGGTGGNLVSLLLIPSTQSVETVNETGQFIAVGTFNSGATQDLTSAVAWGSSDIKVATVNASGLTTGISQGVTTITAIAKSSTGTVTTAIATFEESALNSGSQLATLTVYKLGINAHTGTVESPDTVPTLLINCGSAAGCTGNFTIGSTVVLTEIPGPGSTFGGWSSNCNIGIPNPPPNQCTVVMADNDTVGAIFN